MRFSIICLIMFLDVSNLQKAQRHGWEPGLRQVGEGKKKRRPGAVKRCYSSSFCWKIQFLPLVSSLNPYIQNANSENLDSGSWRSKVPYRFSKVAPAYHTTPPVTFPQLLHRRCYKTNVHMWENLTTAQEKKSVCESSPPHTQPHNFQHWNVSIWFWNYLKTLK